jgi:ATP-dependent protease ClpP protease subunit
MFNTVKSGKDAADTTNKVVESRAERRRGAAIVPEEPFENLEDNIALGTESLVGEIESSDAQEADCGDDDMKDTPRFGARRVPMLVPQEFPHIDTKTVTVDGVSVEEHTVYLTGEICYDRKGDMPGYLMLVHMLRTVPENTTVTILIDSPGGAVGIAAEIVSAMHASKAHVVTVAMGCVASAATMIWFAGNERKIEPAANFMFHMSSHFAYGNSAAIAHNGSMAVTFMDDMVFMPMVAAGVITEEELSLIRNGTDVYVSGIVLNDRLLKLAEVQNTSPPAGEDEPKPAETDADPEADVPPEDDKDAGDNDEPDPALDDSESASDKPDTQPE